MKRSLDSCSVYYSFLVHALVVALLSVMAGCKDKEQTLFRLVEAEKHGIDFVNAISESDTLNILTLEYIYNGG